MNLQGIEGKFEKRLGGNGWGRDKGWVRKNALILAPHPDDESITGLLPLRLRKECGFRIWVIPVTFGSLRARQAARRQEMKAACDQLGFRIRSLKQPMNSIARIRELSVLLDTTSPSVVFMPHLKDGHPTHQATHRLGVLAMDACSKQSVHVVETEYWHPLMRPNLMVAADQAQLIQLCSALACHEGEIARNDYAARLPAWMMDNVRRGSELIGGAGAMAPDMAYATLYRSRRRINGAWRQEFRGGRRIESSEELGALTTCWAQ